MLDPAAHRGIVCSPALADLLTAAQSLLDELAPGPAADRLSAGWAAHVARTAQRLTACGASLRPDLGAATRDYVAARTRWNPRLHALAGDMLHDWAEIAPSPA